VMCLVKQDGNVLLTNRKSIFRIPSDGDSRYCSRLNDRERGEIPKTTGRAIKDQGDARRDAVGGNALNAGG
jgi:hypothetical protein